MPLVDGFVLARSVDGDAAAQHHAPYVLKTRRFQDVERAVDIDLKGDGWLFGRIGWIVKRSGVEDALDRVLLDAAQQAAQIEYLAARVDDLPLVRLSERGQGRSWANSIEDHYPVAAFGQHTGNVGAKKTGAAGNHNRGHMGNPPYGVMMIIFVSVISSIAYRGPSRSMPLTLTPP